MAQCPAPRDAGDQPGGLVAARTQQSPAFRACQRRHRQIEAARQAVGGLALAYEDDAPAMRLRQKSRHEARQRRRSGHEEVGWCVAHVAKMSATMRPCGNASMTPNAVLMAFRRIPTIENTTLRREPNKRLGPMIFWSIAIAVTAIACAVMFYAAAGRTVNAAGPELTDANAHFRQLLAGIDADLAAGKLGEAEAIAAKGELARELLRVKADGGINQPKGEVGRGVIGIGVALVAVIALGLYSVLGHPDLPTQPLAGRPEAVAQNIDLETAVSQIEAALARNPEDLRGWTVIAPAYVEIGRFADAVNAYRRILALSPPNAEVQTNLAEALLLQAGGDGSNEAMDLLRAAAASDPNHIRSRLYVAAELMRTGDYAQAAQWWQQALALSKGDEPWLAAAQRGLSVAENNGVDVAAQQQSEMIQQMVSGLSQRLMSEGGTVAEWTQLLRSYLVLGDQQQAQAAYDAAVKAYPAAFDRGELDTLALSAGLTLNGDAQ